MLKLRTTLIAALIFLGLLVFVFWDMSTRDQRETVDGGVKRLVGESELQVEWIEISADPVRQREMVRMECRAEDGCGLASNANWEIMAPEKTDADSANIGAFLAALAGTNYNERIPIDEKLKARDWLSEFSLQTPMVTVKLKLKKSGEPLRFDFGGAAMVGNDHYALSSRDPNAVFAVPGYFVRAIDRDFFHWRNKQFFPGVEVAKIRSAHWKHEKLASRFRAERDGDDWKLTEPKLGRADFLAVDGIVSGFATWTARATADPEVKLAKNPTLVAEFVGEDGKANRIEVFPLKDKTKFVAKSSARAWLGEVNANEVMRAVKTFPELRDSQILSRNEAKIATRAEVERLARKPGEKAENFTMLLQQGLWVPEKTEGSPERTQRIAAFLGFFKTPEVQAYVPKDGKVMKAWQSDYQLAVRFQNDKKELVKEFRVYTDGKSSAFTEGESAHELRRLSDRFAKAAALDESQPIPNADSNVTGIPSEGGGHVH